MYMYVYIYIYTYVYREREMCIYIYIYVDSKALHAGVNIQNHEEVPTDHVSNDRSQRDFPLQGIVLYSCRYLQWILPYKVFPLIKDFPL